MLTDAQVHWGRNGLVQQGRLRLRTSNVPSIWDDRSCKEPRMGNRNTVTKKCALNCFVI